jgi:hypothetical protein
MFSWRGVVNLFGRALSHLSPQLVGANFDNNRISIGCNSLFNVVLGFIAFYTLPAKTKAAALASPKTLCCAAAYGAGLNFALCLITSYTGAKASAVLCPTAIYYAIRLAMNYLTSKKVVKTTRDVVVDIVRRNGAGDGNVSTDKSNDNDLDDVIINPAQLRKDARFKKYNEQNGMRGMSDDSSEPTSSTEESDGDVSYENDEIDEMALGYMDKREKDVRVSKGMIDELYGPDKSGEDDGGDQNDRGYVDGGDSQEEYFGEDNAVIDARVKNFAFFMPDYSRTTLNPVVAAAFPGKNQDIITNRMKHINRALYDKGCCYKTLNYINTTVHQQDIDVRPDLNSVGPVKHKNGNVDNYVETKKYIRHKEESWSDYFQLLASWIFQNEDDHREFQGTFIEVRVVRSEMHVPSELLNNLSTIRTLSPTMSVETATITIKVAIQNCTTVNITRAAINELKFLQIDAMSMMLNLYYYSVDRSCLTNPMGFQL